ncbi:uncharacterized protein LOC120440207 isoform X1 [Oreochromis aureus]|uniref:uncharacterized protein LOC120440207 isoform X1 n=1 Tax=Oreochromis aureus TaxID=47969 RepID=UPI0019547F3F|nr:uncharacterized protein LOC120440207 isoform X1 [Oreochromis aureus]
MKYNPSSGQQGRLALIQHVPGTVLQYIRVWMCSIHVSLLAGLHGISQQQMDTKESEIKIFYVMGRPKSSRYCRQPLLNNLSASVALSLMASGFAVIFTLTDPVPQSLWAAYHVFGLLSCGQGLCTTILTLTAAACAKTTPELYYMSLVLTVVSAISTGFFMVRGGLWLTNRRSVTDPSRNNEL